MLNKDFIIVRGNTGTIDNEKGIVIRLIDSSDNSIIPLEGKEFEFSTEDGIIMKLSSDLIIEDNKLIIPITRDRSKSYAKGQIVKYELEQIENGLHKTILLGNLQFIDGGMFNE